MRSNRILNDTGRHRQIGWLALQGYIPKLRRHGDMNQLTQVGVESEKGDGWIEPPFFGYEPKHTLRFATAQDWESCAWEDIPDRWLNCFYNAVANGGDHEP